MPLPEHFFTSISIFRQIYRVVPICARYLWVEISHNLLQPAKCPSSLYKVLMDCWSYEPGSRPAAAALHEQITHLLTQIELGHENNLYIVNNQPTAKVRVTQSYIFNFFPKFALEIVATFVAGELSAHHEPYSSLSAHTQSQPDEIEHIFTRNPTIPPKKFPKVSRIKLEITGQL